MPRKIILDVENDLWIKFKTTIPRTKTLNEAIVELIKKAVEKIPEATEG